MPHHDRAEVSGRITDIFAHRFVIETKAGERVLADLGPKGVTVFALATGAEVTAEGEMKPSELKVDRIKAKGGEPITIPHKPKHDDKHPGPKHHHHADANPEVAMKAVRAAGIEPFGEPQRRPKHFEVLGRRATSYVECHVEFDGHIRREKIVSAGDPKWTGTFATAARI